MQDNEIVNFIGVLEKDKVEIQSGLDNIFAKVEEYEYKKPDIMGLGSIISGITLCDVGITTLENYKYKLCEVSNLLDAIIDDVYLFRLNKYDKWFLQLEGLQGEKKSAATLIVKPLDIKTKELKYVKRTVATRMIYINNRLKELYRDRRDLYNRRDELTESMLAEQGKENEI